MFNDLEKDISHIKREVELLKSLSERLAEFHEEYTSVADHLVTQTNRNGSASPNSSSAQ